MDMTDHWLPDEAWDRTVIPPWKLRLLKMMFPRRKVVVLRGRTYMIRS